VAWVCAALERGDAALGLFERAREFALMKQCAGQQLRALDTLIRYAPADRVERGRGFAADLMQRRERERHRGERLAIAQRLRRRAGTLKVGKRLGRRPPVDRDVCLPEVREQLGLRAQAQGSVGQLGRGVERQAEVSDALAVGAAGSALARGQPEEAHGRRGAAAGEVVHRDSLRDLGRGAEGRLETLREATVELCATRRRDRLEHHVAEQAMDEGEGLCLRAIRPLHGPLGLND
jgi:hypothetical protein